MDLWSTTWLVRGAACGCWLTSWVSTTSSTTPTTTLVRGAAFGCWLTSWVSTTSSTTPTTSTRPTDYPSPNPSRVKNAPESRYRRQSGQRFGSAMGDDAGNAVSPTVTPCGRLG